MQLIGRDKEKVILDQTLESKKPELLVVYGRRRVGKTYLIKEYFGNVFSFYSTGVSKGKTDVQLLAFKTSLEYYWKGKKKVTIGNWFEAFSALREFLESDSVERDPSSHKRIIFLDEVPWFATPKSNFESALDYFWNSWASTQPDLVLILCGSATSWIISHFLSDKKGFYNRVTNRIHLMPFSIRECKELSASFGLTFSDDEILEGYLTFGGIPYYWNLLNRRMSMEQNIEWLIYDKQGALHYEYEELFSSLFKDYEQHSLIIDALSERRGGLTRQELSDVRGVVSGKSLTTVLRELEQCGFIRKYDEFPNEKRSEHYQIIDLFLWFCIQSRKEHRSSYLSFKNTPRYYAFRGHAFETLCFNHIDQIKESLGISGIETSEYEWHSKKHEPGAQIDLIIDRRDNTMNLCEIKCVDGEFEITKDYDEELREKIQVFSEETKVRKSLRLTMITFNGVKKNSHYGVVQNEVVVRSFLTE